jgi:transposase-like protein
MMESMMKEKRCRRFSREFKLAAIGRLEAGESGADLALELGVGRTLIYQWRLAWRSAGAEGLRLPGRPAKDLAAPRAWAAAPGLSAKGGNKLAAAQRRVAELERKVGQQQLDLDFFNAALQHFDALERPSDETGATRPSPSSRR